MIRSAIKRSKKIRYSLIALGVAVAFLCVLSVRAQASIAEESVPPLWGADR